MSFTLAARSPPLAARSLLKPAIPLLLSLAAFGSAQAATTYYVRTDGGDAAQCNGKADARYSGNGTNQACAWKHPYYALPPNETARISGGDTLMIGSGSYMIGLGAPGAADKSGRCYAGGPYDCYLPPIPSGTSASAKTRILGMDAKNPPKLWGTERVTTILNLNGSSNVEIGNLEITDQSDCVEGHSNAGARCERNNAPYGQWASAGIAASNSKNVWLHDLNIHGLAHTGIHAGGLTDWTLDRVKINNNGWVGWDGDIGPASSNSGQIIMREVEIAWNGCGERWKTGEPWACWAQEGGGYGDGLGTAKTGGQWLIEDSFIHHNTSDGLDLLYMDGAANTSVTVRRVYAASNAGNQLKVHGNSTIENSVVNGDCSFFAGKDFMLNGDQCRAQGNTLSIGLMAGQTANIRHNTIVGEGDCLILTGGGTNTTKLNIENNILVGKPDYLSTRSGWPEQTCAHYADGGNTVPNFAGNLVWQTKGQCPPGSDCSKDPKLKNATMANFDPEPMSDSPAIDKGIAISGITHDFLLQPRPSGAGPDIGAYELQAGGTSTPPVTPPVITPPSCTRAAPRISLTGPTNTLAAGSKATYALWVVNNDSVGCGSTNFKLAKTVPQGWTSSLVFTLSIAPGEARNANLVVTSPGTAKAGKYAIAAGVSSNVGQAHTASATASYTVAATTPPPATTGEMTHTVELNKSVFTRGESVVMTARAMKGSTPVSGARVVFNVTRPNGQVTKISATTTANGYATGTLVIGKAASDTGSYVLRSDASSGRQTISAYASFTAR